MRPSETFEIKCEEITMGKVVVFWKLLSSTKLPWFYYASWSLENCPFVLTSLHWNARRFASQQEDSWKQSMNCGGNEHLAEAPSDRSKWFVNHVWVLWLRKHSFLYFPYQLRILGDCLCLKYVKFHNLILKTMKWCYWLPWGIF